MIVTGADQNVQRAFNDLERRIRGLESRSIVTPQDLQVLRARIERIPKPKGETSEFFDVVIFHVSPVLLPDGTAAAPAIAFMLDQDTGIYRSAEDTLSTSVGGSIAHAIFGDLAAQHRFRWYSEDASAYTTLDVYNGSFSYFYHTSTPAAKFYIRNTANDSMNLGTNNLDRWLIHATGHLVPAADDTYNLGSDSSELAQIWATPMCAMWKSDSVDGSSVPVWDTDVINTNTSMFEAESGDTQIHVNNAGIYRITVDFNLTLAAGAGANVDLRRNGSTIDARATVDNGDTTGAAAKSGSLTCIVSAAATDYWEVVRNTGTWQTNDVYNRFCIERLN